MRGNRAQDGSGVSIIATLEKLQQAITTEDTESIKSATAELEQAAQAFGKVLYEKAGAAGAAPDAPEAAAESDSGDDDAIDAEFEVKND